MPIIIPAAALRLYLGQYHLVSLYLLPGIIIDGGSCLLADRPSNRRFSFHHNHIVPPANFSIGAETLDLFCGRKR